MSSPAGRQLDAPAPTFQCVHHIHLQLSTGNRLSGSPSPVVQPAQVRAFRSQRRHIPHGSDRIVSVVLAVIALNGH